MFCIVPDLFKPFQVTCQPRAYRTKGQNKVLNYIESEKYLTFIDYIGLYKIFEIFGDRFDVLPASRRFLKSPTTDLGVL